MPILLAVVAGFASGIFFRSLFVVGWGGVGFALLIAALFAGSWWRVGRRAYSLAALFFIFVALGLVRASLADTPLPEPFAARLGERVSYIGVVVSDPDVRDSTQRITVRVSEGDTSTLMLAVVPRYSEAAVGERVRVSGTLEVPEPFAEEGGRVFRYDQYLAKSGVRYLLSFGSISVEEEAPWYSVPALLASIKHAFVRGIDAALPEPYASLAGGIVIGGKSGLGRELQDAFIHSGLIQIIVLSGYNVMIVAEWVMALLSYLRLSRRWATIAGAAALILFVGIAGASATAIRAALMALIALYARVTGHSYAASRALLVVVFLMLLYNPLYLVFDPGFDLSVVATAGLIWLAPRIEEVLKITNAFWKNAIATTLAAQIAVLPLLLYMTGNLSLVAIPANLLAAPAVPLAMGLSALAGVVGALMPGLALVSGLPAYLVTAYLIALAENAAAVPAAAFLLPAFPFVFVLAAYAVLIYFASSRRFSTTLQLRFSKKASM